MIQENELRVGNYLYDGVGGIIKVEVDDLYDNVRKYYEPIELTEEILLKCPDIENRNTNPKSYYLHNRIIFINDNGCYDYATRVKLPYLHTFQNFIFALTNKELNITL